MRKSLMMTAAAVLLTAAFAAAETPDAADLIQKSLNAYHYGGADGKSTISMEIIDKNGSVRERKMVMLRLNIGDKGGDQRFFVYFKEPGDVREMTFMVYKNVKGDDDRWIFVPSVKLVRRLAADDKRSSFVGSDFTYEDVSGRSVAQDEHTFVKEEDFNGQAAYVVKSVPKDKVEYSHKLTWISKDTYLPLKEEYYNGDGKLSRVFTAENIEKIDDIPTPIKRVMENLESGSKTVITIEKADYNVNLDEKDFSERRMRRPPRNWIR